ncbi:beta-lactamase class C and other penicillin binding proteins [Lachnospiraceae bacterium KM106-2]|nr:beta-lactamase class C and other penicillin binding proteins [Lachnospiraceae bacterium KM106-2]
MYQLDQVKHMSFKQMIKYTTKKSDDVRISVGIIKDGKSSYTVYGKDGKMLPQKEYLYEIGSITKTFDGALLCKAVKEGKIGLEDTIDQYLQLSKRERYPTIADLVTHTSGYKSYYFEREMIGNHLRGKNDFYGISKDKLLKRIDSINLENKGYAFSYSNFGMAVVGLVLESVYGQDYTKLMDRYLQSELNMKNTFVSGGSNCGKDFWDWKKQDAYIPAGALISTIGDMLDYAQMQLEEKFEYLELGHRIIKEINYSNVIYDKIELHLDQIGVNWIYDKTNQIYWHNGGTKNYNSHLCFDPKNKIATVVLSNQKPTNKIPATILGNQLFKELIKD